jgi:hypothetical protein
MSASLTPETGARLKNSTGRDWQWKAAANVFVISAVAIYLGTAVAQSNVDSYRAEWERLSDELEACRARAAASRPRSAAEAIDSCADKAEALYRHTEIESLYQHALATERGGNAKDAVRLYRRAARAGSGKAAKRLGDIFACGLAGVARDDGEALRWYDLAFRLGEPVPTRRDC